MPTGEVGLLLVMPAREGPSGGPSLLDESDADRWQGGAGKRFSAFPLPCDDRGRPHRPGHTLFNAQPPGRLPEPGPVGLCRSSCPRHLPDARLALCLLGRQAEVGGCADGVQDAGHDGLERAAEMETDSRAGRFGPGPQQSAQPRAVTEGHTAVSTRSRAGWPSRHVRTASRTAGAVSRSSSPARGMRP